MIKLPASSAVKACPRLFFFTSLRNNVNRVVIATCGILSHKEKCPCCVASFHQCLITLYWICHCSSKLHGNLPLKYDDFRKLDTMLVPSIPINLKPNPAEVSYKKFQTQSKDFAKKMQIHGNKNISISILVS